MQFVDISENALYYLIFQIISSMHELFYLAKFINSAFLLKKNMYIYI